MPFQKALITVNNTRTSLKLYKTAIDLMQQIWYRKKYSDSLDVGFT